MLGERDCMTPPLAELGLFFPSMQSTPITRERIASIDALRGLVIILMALDHVRTFFGPLPFSPLDLTQTTPAWFLTRYVTHLCAPIFVFLAGVSAGLYGQQAARAVLARFLATRGMLLIFLECTFVSLSWGALFGGVVFLQVIWALGVSMVVLAGLVHLPRSVVAGIALALIAGHNALDTWHAADFPRLAWLWSLLHERGFHSLSLFKVYLSYPVLPWIGVMAAGYVAAPWLQRDTAMRQRGLLLAGGALLILMLALRAGNLYGDPQPWSAQGRGHVYSVFSFINFEKYPPSLLFLCVTLGLGAWTLAILSRIPQSRLRWLLVFGKVPMFFYLVHLPLIHIGAQIWAWERYGQLAGWGLSRAKPPADYVPDLALVYGMWAAYVIIMYAACRWYGGVKSRHAGGLLRYL